MTDQTPDRIKPKATTSLKKKLGLGLTGLVIAAALIGAHGNKPAQTLDTTNTASKAQVQSATTKPVVTHKTVNTTESVAFSSTTANDASLAKGTTKVTVAGVNGVRTHTYDVTYTDGTETARTETSSSITQAPVNQVTAIGTYVAPAPQPSCPNGTYV